MMRNRECDGGESGLDLVGLPGRASIPDHEPGTPGRRELLCFNRPRIRFGAVSMFLIVDRTMVRAGVHRMLEQGGRFRIVGAAADPLSALPEFLESRSDLVVCAFYRELQPAVGWLAPLKQARPTCRVLLLEEHESQAGRVAFLDGGVDAVIPAAAAPNELLLALDSIRRGYPYLSPALAGRIREESQRSSTEG